MLLFSVHAVATESNATGAEIHVKVEVVSRLWDLEECFSGMLKSIRQSYVNCDLAEMKFFFKDLLDAGKFENCASIGDILEQLRQGYVDTFNIRRLKLLATHFPRDGVEKLIDDYNEKMEAFLTATAITKFHQQVSSRAVPVLPGDKATVTIKIPRELASRRTLKDMKELAGKAFGDYYDSFVNLHVVAGSIIIIWFFPKHLADKLEKRAQENESIFKQEGVEKVAVAGKVVFLRSSEVGTHTCTLDWMTFSCCLFVCRS